MSKLLRYFGTGQSCFVTVVTRNRRPILIENIDLFRQAGNGLLTTTTCRAWVALPDHFHMILDCDQDNPSAILQRFKMSFGARYRKRAGLEKGSLWQARFWDHIIRDQSDLNRHLDYIHFNPVKHGFVAKPVLWFHSSFLRYNENGCYPQDWGCHGEPDIEGEYGE